MFQMSDLSIALKSAKKSYTFPFQEMSLESVAPNSLDMLHRQNWVEKLKFLLLVLNLQISVPLKNYYHCFNVNSSKILYLLY